MSNLPGDDQSTQQLPPEPVQQAPVAKEQRDAFGGEAPRSAEWQEEEPGKEEVESWLERIERGEDINLPQPVTDDQTGQVLVSPAQPKEPQIVLPVTQVVVQKGLHMKIWDSVRWLAEWSLRILKMFPGRAVYKEE